MEHLNGFVGFSCLCILFRFCLFFFGRFVLRLDGAVDLFNYLVKRQSGIRSGNFRFGLNIDKGLRRLALRRNVLFLSVSDKLLYIHSVVLGRTVCLGAYIDRNIFLFLSDKRSAVFGVVRFNPLLPFYFCGINSFLNENIHTQKCAARYKHKRCYKKDNKHNCGSCFAEKHFR